MGVAVAALAALLFVGEGVATSSYCYTDNGTGVFSDHISGCHNTNAGAFVNYVNDYGATLYVDMYFSSGAAYGPDMDDRCASPLIYEGCTHQSYRIVDAMYSPVVLWYGTGYHSTHCLNRSISNADYITSIASYRTTCQSVVDMSCVLVVSESQTSEYMVSGGFDCIEYVSLYIKTNSLDYIEINHTTSSPYCFPVTEGCDHRLVFSDGAYYDFTCTGDEIFDYDACIYVYGYTCGVTDIKLYKDDGGWVLDDSASQGAGYDVYEMLIVDGEDYKISFIDSGIGGTTVVHNQTFSCTGSHVLIDFDRCQWVYPPSAGPEAIYLWAGYDYNIVIMKDAHGNFVENSQVAIYDKTDDTHIYKWADTPDGYLLLGTKFDTDHDVQITARTFDGIFTLNTVFPANGTPIVGEEDIAITNWTIPIMYNLGLQPVDQIGKPIFDVFCGLVEYTPINPLSFWGMDLSDRGYVPVTNCSGFAMCDIIAEKDGYTDYNVSMINWTSRSAMVKDYRHNIVMEEE